MSEIRVPTWSNTDLPGRRFLFASSLHGTDVSWIEPGLATRFFLCSKHGTICKTMFSLVIRSYDHLSIQHSINVHLLQDCIMIWEDVTWGCRASTEQKRRIHKPEFREKQAGKASWGK